HCQKLLPDTATCLTDALSSNLRDLPLAALDLQQHGGPRLQRRAPFREVVVGVVGTLYTSQLVPQPSLRDFAAAAEGCEVCSHSPPQVMQSEVRDTVLDAGESGIQGVYSDV